MGLFAHADEDVVDSHGNAAAVVDAFHGAEEPAVADIPLCQGIGGTLGNQGEAIGAVIPHVILEGHAMLRKGILGAA